MGSGGEVKGTLKIQTVKMKYCICWTVPSTGTIERGAAVLSFEIATAWIIMLRDQFPDIDHWIEDEQGFIPSLTTSSDTS